MAQTGLDRDCYRSSTVNGDPYFQKTQDSLEFIVID